MVYRHEGVELRRELVDLDHCGDIHPPGETDAVALAARQAPIGFRARDPLFLENGLEFFRQGMSIGIIEETVAQGIEDLLLDFWRQLVDRVRDDLLFCWHDIHRRKANQAATALTATPPTIQGTHAEFPSSGAISVGFSDEMTVR